MIKKLLRVARLQLLVSISLIAIAFGVSSCARFPTKHKNNNAPSSSPETNKLLVRQGLVNDYADVLDSASETSLTRLLQELNQSKSVETVVVIVKDTGGQPIFDYSLQLANQWRIGTNGRGVLFMLSIDDRKWQIQVTSALESVLTHELTKETGDKSADFFKKKEYAAGVEFFVTDLRAKLGSS